MASMIQKSTWMLLTDLFLYTIAMIIFVIVVMAPISKACTGIYIQNGKHYIFARNFDWPEERGAVFINKKDLSKKAMIAFLGAPNAVQWVSRYGSLTFNQVGCDLPNFGVNEAGLAVQGFIFNRAEYPEPDDRPIIAQAQWKQFLLDTCATIADVEKACETVRIHSPTGRFGMHYMVCDQAGDCITIDFIDGQTILRTGQQLPITAYVDSSTYDECYDYLKQHTGFGGKQTAKPVRGTNSSLDRFVRVAKDMQTSDGTVKHAFNLLDEAKISGYTQWQIVYESKTKIFYYRTRLNKQTRYIDASDLNYSCKRPTMTADMTAVKTGTLLGHFKPFSIKQHSDLIQKINLFYQLPDTITEQIIMYPTSFHCKIENNRHHQ